MSNKAGSDAIPPGFATVTFAVPAFAISEELMLTVTCELLTNVVVRGLPFQLATAPETNPVPFTVRVNAGPPGTTVLGTSGLLIRGTGFAVL